LRLGKYDPFTTTNNTVRLQANFDATIFHLPMAFPKVPLPPAPRRYTRAFGSAPAGKAVRIRFGGGARPKARKGFTWVFAYAVDGGAKWSTYTAAYEADEIRVKVVSGDPRGTLLLAGIGYVWAMEMCN
jgi:hypothetical protein